MKGYAKTLKEIGVSYIGGVSTSSKTEKSEKNGTKTYCIYLAPADLSGHNVCPKSEHCRAHCLNESGRNKVELFSGANRIKDARLIKTNLFFKDRETFMDLVCHEIQRERAKAEAEGYDFAVRLNGTSDISPLAFRYKDGRNILEIFPDIMFYDYTKVVSRYFVGVTYPNYDITFSYDGYNWDECAALLAKGIRVAVVFYDEHERLPQTFNGIKVVNGNNYDMRYKDEKGCIIGLSYHRTASDYVIGEDGKRRFIVPNTPFVVKADDSRNGWGE